MGVFLAPGPLAWAETVPSGDGSRVLSEDVMALSRIAALHAAEIAEHDWSDAPYRADRAGHDRTTDTKAPEKILDAKETRIVRMNVMWVTAQVLGYMDPNFDVYEFAEACGVDIHTRTGRINGGIAAGTRRNEDGTYQRPDAPRWTSPVS